MPPIKLTALGMPNYECRGPQRQLPHVGPLKRPVWGEVQPQMRARQSGLWKLLGLPRDLLHREVEGVEQRAKQGNQVEVPATASQAPPDAKGEGVGWQWKPDAQQQQETSMGHPEEG